MNKLIKGKVAEILNSVELVLNIGRESGVKTDMIFEVLSRNGENIKDPDSGEILGSIKRTKVKVKVSEVHEKLSIATTFRNKRQNVGGAGTSAIAAAAILTRSFMPPEWIVTRKTLKDEDAPWEEIDATESFVKIGDPVIQVEIEDDNKE